MDYSFINILLHLDQFLAILVSQYGVWIYLILFLVVFCETGVLVLPFLPGDSLLFVAGAVAAQGDMNPYLLAVCLMSAAILGDSTNYLVGRRAGSALFRKESRFIRRDYLERTQAFYARHGGKTVALARFVPIVRTFAPFVAGMAEMPYRKFLTFSVVGSIVWVGSLVTVGYQFGQVEFIRKNLSLIAIIGLSAAVIPAVLGMLSQYLRSMRRAN
ncbi:DedA family protein [Chitinimonas arctica]|uniref:DedA family protein n=1 Tax=Chitinimonas arctica TaxID=2594795 RepID=A0A516SHG0_9NEIS|nr:DedA family protein [Chitinimonas arctica]QDQ27478.1 DedA family protein [Chitinimonas arctica]